MKPNKVLKKHDKDFGFAPVAARVAKDLTEAYPSDAVLIEASVFCVAPAMYLFVDWVIRAALKKDVKRLYFLARDGEIFYKIARIITQKNNLDIDCRYLYSSRISWRLPWCHLAGSDSIDLIGVKSYDLTVNKLLNRFLLSDDEKNDILTRIDFGCGIDEVLNDKQYEDIKAKLKSDGRFWDIVEKKSQETYQDVCGYFRQEGLAEEIKYAIVDSGWTGTMQKCLNAILKSIGKADAVEGYYFGMYDILDEKQNHNLFNTFYFGKSNKGGSLKRKVYFNNNLFECFCANAEAMTLRFAEIAGGYSPVFQNAPPTEDNFNYNLLRECILQFSECAAENKKSYEQRKVLKLVFKLFKSIMTYPDFSIAETFGSIHFSDDTDTTEEKELAAKLSPAQIRRYAVIKLVFNKIFKRRNRVPSTFWLSGSIARSSACFKKLHIINSVIYNYLKYM